MQTPEQLEAFRKLCKENGLGKDDVWQHKQSKNWIMSRAGAEKVQGRNNISIELELCAAAIDFAVVKATATRTVKPEGKPAKKLSVQTLGSANLKNCTQISYYAEMAEKRAKVRAVLMIMGFYELGVYGEEEAEEFARAKNVGAPTLEDAPARPSQPAAPAPTPPALATPAPSGGADLSADEEAEAFLAIADAKDRINEADTLEQLAATWAKIPKAVAAEADVFDAKEERKSYLKGNQTLAA